MTAADISPTRMALPKSVASSERLSPVVTLYIFCVVISVYFYVGPLYLSTLRAMLILLVIPLFARLVMGHFGRMIITDWLFLAYIGWTIPSLAMHNPDTVVQQVGSTGAEFVGGYLVGRAYIRTRGAFIALCKQLAFITLALLPLGLLEMRTADPFIPDLIRRLPGLFSVPDVNIPGRMGLNRVQNAFNHPIHYGLFCSVVFSLNFIALKNKQSGAWRWVSSAAIGTGCFLALSSGALLALLLQLGLITWAFVFGKLHWRWWLLLGLFIVAYIAVDLLSNRTPLRVFLSYATFSAHTAYWRSLIFEYGFQNAWDNPWFGIGMTDWERPSWMYGASMDNFWLVVAVRYGFPAAIFIISGYLYVLLKVIFIKIKDDPELWQIRQAWVFSFVGLTFTLCTVHVWANIYSFVFFMFASGIWLLDTKVKGDEEDSEAEEPTGPSDRHLPYSRFAHVRRERADASAEPPKSNPAATL